MSCFEKRKVSGIYTSVIEPSTKDILLYIVVFLLKICTVILKKSKTVLWGVAFPLAEDNGLKPLQNDKNVGQNVEKIGSSTSHISYCCEELHVPYLEKNWSNSKFTCCRIGNHLNSLNNNSENEFYGRNLSHFTSVCDHSCEESHIKSFVRKYDSLDKFYIPLISGQNVHAKRYFSRESCVNLNKDSVEDFLCNMDRNKSSEFNKENDMLLNSLDTKKPSCCEECWYFHIISDGEPASDVSPFLMTSTPAQVTYYRIYWCNIYSLDSHFCSCGFKHSSSQGVAYCLATNYRWGNSFTLFARLVMLLLVNFCLFEFCLAIISIRP